MEYSSEYKHDLAKGLQRYVALIYEQRDKFDTKKLVKFSSDELRKGEDTRGDLHVKTISRKKRMGTAKAGNFFYVIESRVDKSKKGETGQE